MRFVVSLSIFVSSLLFVGCGGPSQKTAIDLTPVNISTTRVIAGSLFHIAKENGYFENHGLDVSVSRAGGGDEVFKALVSDSVEVALIGTDPYSFVALDFPNIKLLSIVTHSNDNQIIARTDHGINSAQDIRGKTIGYRKTTASHIGLERFLQRHEIGLDEVALVNLSPLGMAGALKRGDIDAYSVWEPNLYNGQKLLPDQTMVFEDQEDTYTWYYSMFADEDYLEENQSTIYSLLDALRDAQYFVEEQKLASQRIVATVVNMPLETVQGVRDKYTFSIGVTPYSYEQIDSVLAWANSHREEPLAQPPQATDLIVDMTK